MQTNTTFHPLFPIWVSNTSGEWWYRVDGRASVSLRYLRHSDSDCIEAAISGEAIETLVPLWEVSLHGCMYERRLPFGVKSHIDSAYFTQLEDAIAIAEWDLVDCEIDRHFHYYEISDFQDLRRYSPK